MNSKTIVNERTGFEVYLEGVKAPPASIRITENEGGFPSAQVSFPATSAMMRILPGTKVQIFGKDPLTDEQILIFEGEINSMGYNKSGSSRSVSFSCVSFMSRWSGVTARPLDSMATPLWREADGSYNYSYENLNPEDKKEAIQKPGYLMKGVAGSLKNRIEQQVTGPMKDLMDKIDLTNFSGYSDEINQILDSDSVAAGEINLLVQYFLKKFELSDPFYGIESAAYNISNSVCTWPNFGKTDPFKNKAAMESFFKMATEFDNAFKKSGSLVLLEALQSILQTMHYNLLAPASYTSSRKFWGNTGGIEGKDPVRAYFTPNLENSPPAKFNLLFPHQVMSFSYSRSFDGEPTRTIGEIKLNYLDSQVFDIEGASAFLTEPGLNITQQGIEENSIGFTPEETYRGINPNVAAFDSFFAEARENFTGDKKAIDEPGKEDYFSLIKPGLTQLTKNSHLRGRMAGRNISFQTTWSPYRMTGVPSAYIEQGDGPSITGVISSITTDITANGNATSTITFRSPRLVYKKDDIDDEDNIINDFSLDPYLDINTFLFDDEVYGFTNIGSSLLAYLKHGKFSKKNETFKEYAKGPIKIVVGGEEKNHQAFEGTQGKIIQMFSDGQSVDEDASIIDFLEKDEKGNIINSLAPDLELTITEDYTRNVYEAIYKITDLYNNIEGQGTLIDKWTNSLTYRNLITKRDYFNSLGVVKPESYSNSKDAVKLFTGTEVTLSIKDSVTANNWKSGTQIPNERELKSRRKSIKNLIGLIRGERERLSKINTLDDRSKFLVMSVVGTLKSKPLSMDIEGLSEDDLDLIDMDYVSGVIRKTRSKARELLEERDEIGEALEEISTESVEEVKIESLPVEFESELFKPYNLTRRKHVDVALTRYVRNSLKSQREDDSESDIRQNLNILE